MELFLQEPELVFETSKVANTQLDEDPPAWARQVITELFRQVPETSEYVPQVMFSKIDPEQGYGLGVVVISNTTDSALAAVRPSEGSARAYVPVVVKNYKLCPLDLLMTPSGKMLPLNGHRLRQVLFRPETFEMVTDDYGDTSLYNLFYPPGRSDNDFGSGIGRGADGGVGGGANTYGPGMKFSSAFDRKAAIHRIAMDQARTAKLFGSSPDMAQRAYDTVSKRLASASEAEIQKELRRVHQNDMWDLGHGKKASDHYSLLEELAPTLLGTDLHRVSRAVESTPGLMKAAGRNHVFLGGLQKLAAAERTAVESAQPLLKTAVDAAPVHVVQLGYSDAHRAYWVKTASRSAFYHQDPIAMSRGEILKFAGEEVVHKVDTDGTVTLAASSGDASGESVDESRWSVIEEPGIYKVKTIHGKEMTGWVLPTLIDLDGTRVPMAVFTNGAVASVQTEVVGARVGSGVDLPSGAAKGTGLFYCVGTSGIMATTPLKVIGQEAEMNGGDSYLVESVTGESSKVRLVPGLRKLLATGGEFHMPETTKFLPLDKEQAVPLCARVDELSKTASARQLSRITLYGGDGQEFGVRFENLPKLASQFPARQDWETAVFTLCLAGVSPPEAHTKLAEASSGRTVAIQGLRDVALAEELVAEARKTASALSQQVTSLRRYLVKEASVLPDVMTVDAVLSLGFINSENVRLFVARLPYLEKALNQVCEFLLASRLGLSEIPEPATARAVRAMDEVIRGLRALALRDVEEGGPQGVV